MQQVYSKVIRSSCNTILVSYLTFGVTQHFHWPRSNSAEKHKDQQTQHHSGASLQQSTMRFAKAATDKLVEFIINCAYVECSKKRNFENEDCKLCSAKSIHLNYKGYNLDMLDDRCIGFL